MFSLLFNQNSYNEKSLFAKCVMNEQNIMFSLIREITI